MILTQVGLLVLFWGIGAGIRFAVKIDAVAEEVRGSV